MTIYLASTPKSMFRLSKLGFLPSIFIDLKYDVTIVASYMFGTASSRQWRTKGGESGYIRKYTDNQPVYGVSVDRLLSYQPGLVP